MRLDARRRGADGPRMKVPAKFVCYLPVLFVMLLSASALAETSPPKTPDAATAERLGQDAFEQAACRDKLPNQLCDLDKGAAGQCITRKLPNGGSVLQCAPAIDAEPFEGGSMAMLTFGVIVAIIGTFIAFRVSKNWNKI